MSQKPTALCLDANSSRQLNIFVIVFVNQSRQPYRDAHVDEHAYDVVSD